MTDTRPPMVVWLQNQQSLNEEQWQDDDVTWCRDKIFKHDVGPYVHLDQFLEEVEAEAQACADEGQNYDFSFVDAVRDKVKEIKEGKA